MSDSMSTEKFRELMAKQTNVVAGSDLFELFHKYSQEALKITSEINNKYNTPDRIRELFAKLTESDIDEFKNILYNCNKYYLSKEYNDMH